MLSLTRNLPIFRAWQHTALDATLIGPYLSAGLGGEIICFEEAI